MRRIRTIFICTALGVCLAAAALRAESQHVFGIHFWDWGANVDVMSHRTGWVVEANLGKDSPNVGGRIKPGVGESFTIVQRLDWRWGFSYDEGTVPKTPADQDIFAAQCANWASQIGSYCRHYVIGNEMELHDGVTVSIYVSAFQRVRNAIKAVQPEARVIIGHFTNDANLQSAMQMLGPNGYDGVADHTGSSIHPSRLNILDAELGTSRPDVGVYITEWGWLIGTTGEAETYSRILDFYNEMGQSNSTRLRQIYCACWFSYPDFTWQSFSLELSGVLGYHENPAFEQTTALGTATNSYASSALVMSNAFADVSNAGTSIPVSWTTSLPARTMLWSRRIDQANGNSSGLVTSLTSSHSQTVSGTTPSTVYEVTPISTADGYGDVGGRRFRVKTGPWGTTVKQTGPGRILVEWTTDWPADGIVEYGDSLGNSASHAVSLTNHAVQITGLPAGTVQYRVLSSEVNPDPGGARLYMRSPTRLFLVNLLQPGDIDGDLDVDQEDFGCLQACISGPGTAQNDPDCILARIDADDDVDSADLNLFLGCLSGAGVTGDPDCAG